MWDGYVEVPITSRAAEAELERQRARRRALSLIASAESGVEAATAAPGVGAADMAHEGSPPDTAA